MSAPPAAATELQRLSFVYILAGVAYTEAEWLYSLMRGMVPIMLGSTLDRVEGSALPFIRKAEETLYGMLAAADARVDATIKRFSTSGSTPDDAVPAPSAGAGSMIQGLVNAYLDFMAKYSIFAVDRLRAAEKDVKDSMDAMGTALKGTALARVEAARDALLAAVDKARQAANPDVAVEMAWSAWTRFAAIPAVARLLETAEPATAASLRAFFSLHDGLVAQPLYKQVIDQTAGTLSYATTTTPYKLGATWMYPMVEPMAKAAEPAIAKVTASKAVNDVIDYWKPLVPTPPATVPVPESLPVPVATAIPAQ